MNTKNNKRRKFISNAATALIASMALVPTLGVARGEKKESTSTITEEQKDKIFYMYQEEKVARDVYITLGNIYPGENTFASIQLSEQRHIDAVEGLCDKYAISKEGVNEAEVGNFVLPELQELYNECVARGEESLYDALKVGEEIEIHDIKDLEESAIGMPSDVYNVFMNLKEGSQNHLEAFQAALTKY